MTELERGSDRPSRRTKRLTRCRSTRYGCSWSVGRPPSARPPNGGRWTVPRSCGCARWQGRRDPGRRRPGRARRSGSWPSSWCWWRGKGVGAEWPGPAPGGRGHQVRAAGLAGAGRRARLDLRGPAGCGGQRAAHLPLASPPRRRRAGRPGAWWQPDARPAGLGGRRSGIRRCCAPSSP